MIFHIRELVEEYSYTVHIRRRGKEKEKRDTGLQGKKVGRGKDTFMAESIQKTPYKMGKEN